MSVRIKKRGGRDKASGVSEVIGAVLMISLVVVAVAIVAVILTSQTTPEKIPNVNFMTGTNAAGTQLYLYHNGGDALQRGEFAVVTDTDPTPRTDFTISDGSTEWSIGRNLILAVPAPPNNVALIYTKGQSGGTLLRSGSSNVAVLRESIRPDPIPGYSGGGTGGLDTSNPQNVVNYILSNTSLIGDAMNQSPSTVGPVVADVIAANSTNFFREAKTTIDENTYFVFYITGESSTFSYGSTAVKSLSPGDIIVIWQAKSEPATWKIFGLGDQIWEFSADGVWVDWKKNGVWINSTKNAGGRTTLYHTWITGYSDIGSTLTIRTTQAGYYTALVHNNQKRIEGISSNTVVIQNIRPVGLGLFVLEYDDNNDAVYFIGNAQSVSW